MGDRAVLLFTSEGNLEPFAVYFHWAGEEGVADLVKRAKVAFSGRLDDPSYFSARLVGLACADSPGETGIGLLAAPDPAALNDPDVMSEYSHGDAGVAILSLPSGNLSWIPGTGYAPREA